MKNTKKFAQILGIGIFLLILSCSDDKGTNSGDSVLTAPVLQSPSDGATEQLVDITLEWETVSSAESYHFQLSTENDFSNNLLDEEGIEDTEYNANGLDYETAYFWRVKAIAGETESDWSEVLSFETEAEGTNSGDSVLTAPVLQIPADGATEQLVDIIFDWEAVSNAENYHFQLSSDNDFTVLIIDEEGREDTEFEVTGLDYVTEYFWRVKAIAGETESEWSSVWSFVTKAEGTDYETVVIGEQEWMQYNLDVTHYRNGDEIPQVTDPDEWANITTGAWCYYNNDSENGETYGKLYNWYAVNDERGLAPEGWRVPSDDDWTTLTNYLGSNAGAKLAGGYDLWYNGNLRNHSDFNSSCFSGLPGGYRSSSGGFNDIRDLAYWWSSTEYSSTTAVTRNLHYSSTSVHRSYHNKRNGRSVRCVRD